MIHIMGNHVGVCVCVCVCAHVDIHVMSCHIISSVAISKREYGPHEFPAFRGVGMVNAPPIAVLELISEPTQ